MDYPIKIAQSNPHHERLEKVIRDLLHFIEAGAVYVSYSASNNAVIITFVLKENCCQDGDALNETTHKFIKLYPDFVFKFINSNWVDYGFKKGKLFFIQHCTFKELVYLEPDTKVFYPSTDTSKQLAKKAKKRFDIDIEAAVVIFRNVSIYTRNNKRVEAAFALHQTLRYIYICASEFLMPEFISSTCLLMHYDYIIDFAPTFKTILNKEIQEDKEILVMLNTAYNSIQQNRNMDDIDTALIDKAKGKIELMQREINRLFIEYIKSCKQKVRDLNNQSFLGRSIFNDRIQPNYIMDEAFSKISAVIVETLQTRAIYCFGYATNHNQELGDKNRNYSSELPDYHFYLLVLNLEHIENVIELLQTQIEEKIGDKYKVTILNHSASYLRKKSHNKKYFLDIVIANGLLIYNNPLYLVYSNSFEVERNLDFSKKYFENRMLLAQQFLSLAQNCFVEDSSFIKNILHHKAVEQIAGGLIYLFLGYHSGKFSMNYLFSLLNYIQEIELPFDFTDEKETAIHQLMLVNSEMIKPENVQSLTIEGGNILEEKCVTFFMLAKEIAEKEFERLENRSDFSTT
ncbi:BTB/POZ domain-containing protein [Flavobacterium hydatis]|uniref:Uncharacterized protein n=1 Tax=Flavobacterium hydatis TaxID=991 RepID=A0A086AFE7_FLAHY|nr:hypothetical protein [Flavobacterium hydatis]KFF15411.1 hypothetical protein IW20_14035 [Flavobacterium hydatis]OXA91358.1 hypothetical protein B0A62_16900 [Flavobacterium hydatis]